MENIAREKLYYLYMMRDNMKKGLAVDLKQDFSYLENLLSDNRLIIEKIDELDRQFREFHADGDGKRTEFLKSTSETAYEIPESLETIMKLQMETVSEINRYNTALIQSARSISKAAKKELSRIQAQKSLSGKYPNTGDSQTGSLLDSKLK